MRKVRGSSGYRTVVTPGRARPFAPGHTIKIFGPVHLTDINKIVPVKNVKVTIKRVLSDGKLVVDLGAYSDKYYDLAAEVSPEYVERARMFS